MRAWTGWWVMVLAVGCSSSTFDVATPLEETASPDDSIASETTASDSGDLIDGAIDSTTTDSTTLDSTTIDTAPLESGPIDTLVAETTPLCPTIASDPVEVFVDAAGSAFKPNGTASCPFAHVNDATALIATLAPKDRTIRVKGGTYKETGAVVLAARTTLSGAGVGTTTISGGGACLGAGTCVLRVLSGAVVDGLSVDASGGGKHGIVTAGGDSGLARLKNVKVTGTSGDGNAGILVTAGASLGPAVEASANALGLMLWGTAKTTVSGGNNHFDKNTTFGIVAQGTGVFEWTDGGTADGNGKDGMRFGDTDTTSPPDIRITGATASSNGGAGIRFATGANGVLRDCTLYGNKFGVVAVYGTNNGFDLGTSGSSGNNRFWTVGTRNTLAGLCAVNTRTTPLPAQSNKWPMCPLTTKLLTLIGALATCDNITEYADVWYRGLSAPDTTNCSG